MNAHMMMEQDARQAPGQPADPILRGWERWLSALGGAALGGGALALYALRRSGPGVGTGIGAAAGVLGGALLVYRGASGHCLASAAFPDAAVRAEDRVIIERSVPEVYAFCRETDNLARFVAGLEADVLTGNGAFEGRRRRPSGDSEPVRIVLTIDRSDRELGWRATLGDTVMHGRMELEALQSRATEVRASVRYPLPPGLRRLALPVERAAVQRFIGTSLRRLKQLMETGEVATTDGQSAGIRSWLNGLMRRTGLDVTA